MNSIDIKSIIKQIKQIIKQINNSKIKKEMSEIMALFLSLLIRSKEKGLITEDIYKEVLYELDNVLKQIKPSKNSSSRDLLINFLMQLHELVDKKRKAAYNSHRNMLQSNKEYSNSSDIPILRVFDKDNFISLLNKNNILLSIIENIINSNNDPDKINQIISIQKYQQPDISISYELTYYNSIKFIAINLEKQPYKTLVKIPSWISAEKDFSSYLKNTRSYEECLKNSGNSDLPLCRKNLVSILALSHYENNDPLILTFFNLRNNYNLTIPNIIWGWTIKTLEDKKIFRFFIPKDNVTSSNHSIKCGRTYDLVTASEDHNGCGTTEWLLWENEIELNKIYIFPTVIDCEKIQRSDTKERFLNASLDLCI